MLTKGDYETLASMDAYDMLDELLTNPKLLQDDDMLKAFRVHNDYLTEHGSNLCLS